MTTVPVDTLQLARKIRDDGNMLRGQAEGVANALAETFRDVIATKADIREMEQRLTIKLGAMTVAQCLAEISQSHNVNGAPISRQSPWSKLGNSI